MAFQLAYGETPVMVAALTIAIREWQSRAETTEFPSLAAESTAQVRIAERMLDRLVTPSL
jgi:hypothetical protein